MTYDLTRRATAEALGTALLVATVVGSGIMASKLASGNAGVALLTNTIPTGAILFVLITALGPISGAHINPAVTVVMARRGDLATGDVAPYIAAQVAGGIVGTIAAHAMFDLPLFQLSSTVRTGRAQWTAEVIAAFGLLVTIFATVRFKADAVAASVALYITAAYWFTASTSFANPAVTIARAMTDTYAGIRPLDVAPFIAAQMLGAFAGAALIGWLVKSDGR